MQDISKVTAGDNLMTHTTRRQMESRAISQKRCLKASLLVGASPTIDRKSLFLRWWAVPNAQRESSPLCRETLLLPRGDADATSVEDRNAYANRAVSPLLEGAGNPEVCKGGKPSLQLLSAHSLWLPYPY